MPVHRAAEGGDDGDDGAGDAGGDQRVFDGGGAVLTSAKRRKDWSIATLRIALSCRFVDRPDHSSAIRCEISGTSAGGIS